MDRKDEKLEFFGISLKSIDLERFNESSLSSELNFEFLSKMVSSFVIFEITSFDPFLSFLDISLDFSSTILLNIPSLLLILKVSLKSG